MRGSRLASALAPTLVLLGACGAGTVTSEDVDPGEAIVIGIVVPAVLLYVGFVGGRGGR